MQYSKGLEDKQFKMLEHDNPVSKYKANFDKCNNVWSRDMVTEFFSSSRRKCEFLKSGIYLCATKNSGFFWTYWPPGGKQTPLSCCASALAKWAPEQGSPGLSVGATCTPWVLLPPPLLGDPQEMELGIPQVGDQTLSTHPWQRSCWGCQQTHFHFEPLGFCDLQAQILHTGESIILLFKVIFQ